MTDQLVGDFKPQGGRLAPERRQSFRAGKSVRRAGEMPDAPMAARVQMRESQANSVGVVGADIRCSTALAPDVDTNERHVPSRELLDQRIVAVDPDENCGVEAVVEPTVARLEQERVVTGLREAPRDRRQHLPEEDERQVAVAGVVTDDDRDQPRLLSGQ